MDDRLDRSINSMVDVSTDQRPAAPAHVEGVNTDYETLVDNDEDEDRDRRDQHDDLERSMADSSDISARLSRTKHKRVMTRANKKKNQQVQQFSSNKKNNRSSSNRMKPIRRIFLKIMRISLPIAIPLTFLWNALSVVIRNNSAMSDNTAMYYDATTPQEQQQPNESIKPMASLELSNIWQESSFVYANTTYRFRYYHHPFGDNAVLNSTGGLRFNRNFQKLQKLAFKGSNNNNNNNNNNNRNMKSETTMRNSPKRLPILVFGVLSTFSRKIRRDAIRATWGRDVPMYFLVAESFDNVNDYRVRQEEQIKPVSEPAARPALISEFDKYGDLLWLDMPEHYRNALTPKTFMFIQFARKILSRSSSSTLGVDYIFKTDDDVWVNATEMSVELDQELWPAYFGMKNSGSRPVRDASATVGAKWVLSWEEYPRDEYPPYASGLGYALSTTTNVLLDPNDECADSVMSSMNAMPWEDVATGLLSEACHVPLTSSFKYWTDTGNGTHDPNFPLSSYVAYKVLKDGGSTIKILHKPKPHWYEALMVQGSLEEANQYEEQRKITRKAERKQRHHGNQEKQ